MFPLLIGFGKTQAFRAPLHTTFGTTLTNCQTLELTLEFVIVTVLNPAIFLSGLLLNLRRFLKRSQSPLPQTRYRTLKTEMEVVVTSK